MNKSKGIGLLDLMVTLVVAAMLVALAIPAYGMFVKRAKVAAAIGDIGEIALAIEVYRLNNNDQMPPSLADLSIQVPLDPWGRPYEFLDVRTAGPGVAGLRKDGKLNPLNTDFDLYSRGRDGDSKGPLSASVSRDDVVRANNGAFIGLGENY
jgi:general secretion pathway protein G